MTTPEPAFHFFSHARKAMGAIGLAALGATVLIGVLPLLRPATPVTETAQVQPPAETPPPVLSNPRR